MVAVDEMYVFLLMSLAWYWSIHSERGVRRAPDLLPKDYMGGDKDQGSIGLWDIEERTRTIVMRADF